MKEKTWSQKANRAIFFGLILLFILLAISATRHWHIEIPTHNFIGSGIYLIIFFILCYLKIPKQKKEIQVITTIACLILSMASSVIGLIQVSTSIMPWNIL